MTANRTTCVRHRRRGGFTLVEVLAAVFLVGVVLPAALHGVSLASRAGAAARHRTDAAGLAKSKLAELIASGEWQNGTLGGDFGSDWPEYRWQATVSNWSPNGVTVTSAAGNAPEEVDVQVTWTGHGGVEQSVTLSTLVYLSPNTGGASSSSGTTN